jgi:mono/diheme cytochrome c family protein
MKHPSPQPAGHALAVLAASAALAAFGFGLATPAAAADAKAEQVKRGQHLVLTSGCHDCHTPFKMGANGPEPDMSRMLSGHPEALVMPPAPTLPPGPWLVVSAATNTAYSGPWGVSFSANLTPDADTGLGQWKASDFRATIRSGRHMGRGRPVLPPMPVPVYNNFSDAELDAIFAYLRTVPAVKNRVPEAVLAAAPAKP